MVYALMDAPARGALRYVGNTHISFKSIMSSTITRDPHRIVHASRADVAVSLLDQPLTVVKCNQNELLFSEISTLYLLVYM